MEEISFKGENYIKASVLADKYGYTADYIGQLCRAGQVKATLVGRSWYVNEESLLAHRKGRYRSTLAKSKEMVRKLAEQRVHQQTPINVKRIVRYETDERELLPELGHFETDTNASAGSPLSLPSDNESEIVEESLDEPEALSVPITRYERPPVRTIPAFAALESRAMTVRPAVRAPKTRPTLPVKKMSWVPALTTAFLLMAELAAVSIALGLEKKLTITEDGQEVTVYVFEPDLIAAAAQSVWKD